ncbi:MAG: dTDP-4-dehydrorhamnose reductase [Candidatus Helarchaeota archaeon]
MLKVLIIGAAGLLGNKIYNYGKEKYDIYLADINYLNFLKKDKFCRIDITDYNLMYEKITEISPDWVILTAALTNVDLCEINQDLAYQVNKKGTENVANIVKKINSKLIYISTDFVFDGNKRIYNEDDIPNPISYYGRSKLEGEKSVKEIGIPYLIIRTSVLFGWHLDPKNQNYVSWVYDKLKNNEKINITISQWNTPTLADNLAQAILKSIDKNILGLYHMAGGECINRYNFALKIANIFNLNESLINPIEEFKQKARRPKYSCLDITKASKDLNFHFYDINDALKFMKNQKKGIEK